MHSIDATSDFNDEVAARAADRSYDKHLSLVRSKDLNMTIGCQSDTVIGGSSD